MENLLPLNLSMLYILAGAILIEFIVFLLIVSKKKLNILRIFFAVVAGNALSAAMMLFLPLGQGNEYYTCLALGYGLSVFFEWLIDIAFFYNREYKASNSRFLACSVFGNLITFMALAIIYRY